MQDSLTIRISKFALFISILLVMIANTGCQQIRARMTIRAAYELYQREQYKLACPLLENAMTVMPNDLDLKQSLAFCYMAWYKVDDPSPENQALVTKGVDILKELIAKRPGDMKPEDSLISLYLNANKYDEAAGYLQGRLIKNPKDVETYKQIASLYIKAKRIEDAFKWYEKWGIEVEPNNPEPWYSIGSYCWRLAYCEQNRCEDPSLPLEKRQYYINRGITSIEEHALAIDPDHCESTAYINLLYRAKAKWVDYGNQSIAQEDMKKAEEFRQKTITCLEKRKKTKEQKTGQAPADAPAKK